ncbi:MAG TPA: 16S rRNA (cytosine(967)-C(5))-methyltransferase RsmB [Burkholderiaceae bacterium]|nr:16S rRNA (cytosine(967)-C(5))-methyltransferase RsmB [Burkholderiaceae bacterium]
MRPAVATGAPLADVLRAAAAVWVSVCGGRSLGRALQDQAARDGGSMAIQAAVRDVCHGALRHRALIEALLQRLIPRPPAPQVGALLAVALSQLLDSAYSDYALVDQAVEAARSDPRLRGAPGFVNAVLRSFLRRRATLVPQLLLDDATRLNVPRWWLQRVRRDHPQRWEPALACAARPPALVLRVNRRRIDVDAYLALLDREGVEASRVGPHAVRLHRPRPVERIAGFIEGLVSIQDAGAQLAAPWLQAGDNMRVLDACAAPGGKTGHLAELSGALIDAVEIDQGRARLIGDNLRRLGLAGPRLRVLTADARDTASFWDGRPYERILLDAPCTGSGVVRRHPDIPWVRREADVAQLATIQAGLLDALWPLLAPAGRLLYVVCSVFREEADQQADSFLERQPDARLTVLPGTQQGSVQLLASGADPVEPGQNVGLPTEHDGFFFALFEKI